MQPTLSLIDVTMTDRLPMMMLGIQRMRRKSRAQIAMIDALIRTPVHSLNSRVSEQSPFFSSRRLFLVGLSLGLLPSALLPLALLSLVGSLEAELGVGATLDGLGHVVLADLVDTLGGGLNGQSGGNGRDGVLDVGLLAVTRLGLATLAGEENELLLVGLEASDVEGKALLAQVGATVVDRDTDGRSKLLGDTGSLEENSISNPSPSQIDSPQPVASFATLQTVSTSGTSYLQLSQGETTAGTNAAVVLDGRASHNGAELVDGAGGQSSSLGLTGRSAADLLGSLCFHSKSEKNSCRSV